MKALSRMALLATALGLGAGPLQAQSKPMVQGRVLGLELAPQFILGSALFAGIFQGQVGQNGHALGVFAVAVTHEDLPESGESADITGGAWEIRAGGKRLRGEVTGGLLINNGDDTFQVLAVLQLTQGGQGQIYFAGLLDHNVFPPTIKGNIIQAPPP